MKTFVTIILGCLLLTACKKEEESTRHVEGYIYKSCKNEPYADMHLTVNGRKLRPMRSTEATYLGAVTTDKNGYYSLTYKSDKDFDGIQLIKDDYGSIIITSYEKKLNMVHYSRPTVQHKVILRVDDTLSAQDTLYMNASINKEKVILPGPFKDNQEFSITVSPNIGLSGGNEFIQDDKIGKGFFYWGLGWDEFMKVSYNPEYQKYPNIIKGPSQPVCGQGGDIVIDLRGKSSSH